MHVPTHLMLSWLVAHRLPNRRDRRCVTWSGVIPDLDGISIVCGMQAYSEWHHVVTHGLFAALVTVVIVTILARDRIKVAAFSMGTFHLHLACDWLGSGEEWPLTYYWPLSSVEYATPYGWPFASWQNWLVAVLALGGCIGVALRRDYSFAELFTRRSTDRLIIDTVRTRLVQFGLSVSHGGPAAGSERPERVAVHVPAGR